MSKSSTDKRAAGEKYLFRLSSFSNSDKKACPRLLFLPSFPFKYSAASPFMDFAFKGRGFISSRVGSRVSLYGRYACSLITCYELSSVQATSSSKEPLPARIPHSIQSITTPVLLLNFKGILQIQAFVMAPKPR